MMIVRKTVKITVTTVKVNIKMATNTVKTVMMHRVCKKLAELVQKWMMFVISMVSSLYITCIQFFLASCCIPMQQSRQRKSSDKTLRSPFFPTNFRISKFSFNRDHSSAVSPLRLHTTQSLLSRLILFKNNANILKTINQKLSNAYPATPFVDLPAYPTKCE